MSLLESITLRQSSVSALRAGQAVPQEPDGRICDEPSCRTRLSRYNPSTSCCQHEGWTEPPGRTRG